MTTRSGCNRHPRMVMRLMLWADEYPGTWVQDLYRASQSVIELCRKGLVILDPVSVHSRVAEHHHAFHAGGLVSRTSAPRKPDC